MKPTVVLVHGAFAESASWDRVIGQLCEADLTVVAAANPLRGRDHRAGVRQRVRPRARRDLLRARGHVPGQPGRRRDGAARAAQRRDDRPVHRPWKQVPCRFVIGEDDRVILAAFQRFQAERAGARRTLEIPGSSRASLVSHPAAVAGVILEAARLPAAA